MKYNLAKLFSVLIMTSLVCVACLQRNVLPASTAAQPLPLTKVPAPGTCTNIGQTWVSPIDDVTLVCVPAGEFLMGVTERASGSPHHSMDGQMGFRCALDASSP